MRRATPSTTPTGTALTGTALARGVLAGVVVLSGCSHAASSSPTPAPTTVASSSSLAAGTNTGPVRIGTAVPNAVPAGKPGTPRGGVQHPNVHDAKAVAVAVAVTCATWDTALDYSTQDAARRAAGWMVPALAIRTRTARTAGSGATWNTLAAGKGWTTATASLWAPVQSSNKGRTVTVPLMLTITGHVTSGQAPATWHELEMVTLTQATPTKTAPVKKATAKKAKTAKPVAKRATAAVKKTAATKAAAVTWQVSQIVHLPSS